MAVRSQNPFESSFENLTTKATGSVKKAVKAVADVAGGVGVDVKQQITGDYGQSLVEEAGLQQNSPQQQQQIQQNQQQILSQTRQNLEQINAQIKRVREERQKKEQESKKVQEQEKKKKEVDEQKKKEDPMWKKMLKGKMGSREASKNAGG